MVNHPNRSQVRLPLTHDELEALVNVIMFAERQGYFALTEYAKQFPSSQPTITLAYKVRQTWLGVSS